jgi:hypothetical protein
MASPRERGKYQIRDTTEFILSDFQIEAFLRFTREFISQ